MSDPRILYDAVSRRWFVAVMDVTHQEIEIGISGGSAPGDWLFYNFPYQDCPDQPRLGLSNAVVAFTVDLFAGNCQAEPPQFIGTDAIFLDKQEMLAGRAVDSSEYGPDYRFPELTPVQSMSATRTEYLVSTDPENSAVQVLSVPSWDGELSWTSMPVGELTQPVQPPQPGTTSLIDPGDNRVQNAVWDRGTLSLAANDGCGVGGTAQSCARIIQIRTASMKVRTDYDYLLDGGRDAYYPALFPDALGDLIIIFGYSSATDYPSVAYTDKPARRGFDNWSDLVKGSTVDTSGRYGDYFGAARDPSRPGRVWIAGQFSNGAGGDTSGWGTTIAAIDMRP